VGISDPRTDIYALGIMFYEMLTGMVPFTGETPVDVMLKVVSQPVVPPRQKAPGIEITPDAERLIMKALSKDPLQRHQTMEELFNDLQRCYGSVRYRRQLELRTPEPVPLESKRSSAQHFVDEDAPPPPIGRASGTIPIASADPNAPGQSPAPILLTKKKERKRTLPLGLGIEERVTPPAATPAVTATSPDEPAWIEGEDDEPTQESPEWSDIDIDAPSGTRG
jgi:serine/threonine-protein kinase